MDPKAKKQKLSSSEIASPSLSKMELKKNKKKKNKQKVDVGKAMKKQNDVAMFLTAKVISAVARNSNFVFSPASINAVLTMVAASSEKETLRSFIFSLLGSSIDELKAVFREMATVVLVDGSESGGPKIAAVNGVWMDQSLSFNPLLKDLLESFFMAAFAQVDFQFKGEQVREEVNSWASKHTNDLIKSILPPGSVKSDTMWIYGNALYFKGAWERKFAKSLTKDQDFHLLNGTSVSVPFISSPWKQCISDYEDFKVLKLPFGQSGDINRQFSMYFYLPEAKDGLDHLVKRMASTSGFLDSHIPTQKVQVGKFGIPKFKIEFGFEALKAFNEWNLEEVSLYHKVLVEIDEDGAEAASVTAKGGRRGRRGDYCDTRIDFVADHPFLFMIREDKTETVLFVGQIFDPSKSP